MSQLQSSSALLRARTTASDGACNDVRACAEVRRRPIQHEASRKPLAYPLPATATFLRTPAAWEDQLSGGRRRARSRPAQGLEWGQGQAERAASVRHADPKIGPGHGRAEMAQAAPEEITITSSVSPGSP